MALSVPGFALYELHRDCWKACKHIQSRIKQIGEKWTIDFVELRNRKLGIGIFETLPLGFPMINCDEDEWMHKYLEDFFFFP